MSRVTRSLAVAAIVGQLVGLLGWIGALFLPLVIACPPITGAIAASRRVRYAWIGVLWFSAGINMLWTDWIVNDEDKLFHLVLSVVMPVLAGIGWGVVSLVASRRAVPVGDGDLTGQR